MMRRMRVSTSWLALSLLPLLASLAGCGTAGLAEAPAAAPPAGPQPGAALPAFPDAGRLPDGPSGATTRLASATEIQQTGSQRILDSGGTHVFSPSAAPADLVIAPDNGSEEAGTAAGHRAWALFRFDGLDSERPLRLRTDVAQSAVTPDGSPVPLEYYVGVADQSLAAWEWHGPLTADGDVLLNGAPLGGQQRRQRMIDANGVFFACVVVDSHAVAAAPGNPAGQAAVRLSSMTVTASDTALATKPLFLAPSLSKTGAAVRSTEPPRRASALQPAQFPVIGWQEFAETELRYFPCAATSVEIWRRGPTDAAALKVGDITAGSASFTDPLNLAPGQDPAVGGRTYRYFIRARNTAGLAGMAAADTLTVPMLAPLGLQASQDSPGGSGIELNWQASDGAEHYRILRGKLANGSGAVAIATVAGGQTSYEDRTCPPGQFLWYFIQAEGLGDGDAANGLEAGALSTPGSPAQGLRGLVLALSCTAAGITGDGSAQSPYVLSPGQDYQFAVADQAGNPLTQFCSYTVTPPASASFAGAPGLLSAVQAGAGVFSVKAVFSYAGFEWQASASCHCD